MENLLNIILFLPLLATLLMFGKIIDNNSAKYYAITITLIELILCLLLWYLFDENNPNFQFITMISLMQGINYHIGIDGISLFLIILSAFIILLCVIFLDNVANIKNFLITLLLLESIMIGVFISLDMILFYIFWEVSLVPMLYIIGAWGGENRIYASIKFFLYTFSASVIMLFGILYFAYLYYISTGIWSFNILDWYMLQINFDIQKLLFIAFFIGIAVKIPIFPLHTWLPYAHGQAPTIGSVILAAILLKMGTYAFIRFSLPLFPDASIAFITPIAILCVIMVIYTAMIAFAQKDIKQVIAYSSISHMGIIVLGIFSLNIEGISGSIFFMISHGIISGALFMMVGVIYDRTHTKMINHYGGIAKVMPRYTLIFGILLMGSIGLPLTIGFVGEFLCLLGFFSVNKIITILAGSGIIFGAIYMLNLFRNVFLGNLKEHNLNLTDINKREAISILPLILIIIWLGIYPKIILDKVNLSVNNLVVFMYEKSILNESKNFLSKVNEEVR
ncbi:NADH-quinone oxidoreductase subunit M [Helicobacter sp. MIT 14-3879]|uniref:NADH-quinone oxidoreductase subunit M n=1 Tax=Helicobacter sp. MIT 14-3879 TaxID=2040649 RepID=UPI000E1F88DD|nr:NADH-quinone oxidoreductase subunit M [Helicobacter sp. MIT 14-3879]RDU63947.1 NADH-quinone oxidoreductase subunit M [Helicobacter sp. MIT 14-3879]